MIFDKISLKSFLLSTAKLEFYEQTIRARRGRFLSKAYSPKEPPTPILHTCFKGGIGG